ncbi:MAG: VWA domain-containing protein [Thermoanaerobacteraceae bacterium]|nr:VWA domain-containing protein [Thermoanaerobacteraceae bacterium]
MSADITMRLINVVTDGCSNIGLDPCTAAGRVHKDGIIVNAIGILDGNGYKDKAVNEIEGIARSGGGVSDIVKMNELGKTLTSATMGSVANTLTEVVDKELREVLRKGLDGIHPELRFQVVDFIEKLTDEVNLRVVVVIDASGSMANKMNEAKRGVIELLKSLKGRKGDSNIALVCYPSERNEPYLLRDFTSDIDELERLIVKIAPGGGTPTAAAIEFAARLLEEKPLAYEYMV